MPSGQLADPGAHLGRAGEADLVDQPLAECPLETLEGGWSVALHDVQYALRQPAAEEELGHRLRRRGGVFGWLPHHRVSAQQRRDQVPGRHRNREVAGGDVRRYAHRDAEGEELLVGHLRWDRLAVETPTLAKEEAAGVDDLL